MRNARAQCSRQRQSAVFRCMHSQVTRCPPAALVLLNAWKKIACRRVWCRFASRSMRSTATVAHAATYQCASLPRASHASAMYPRYQRHVWSRHQRQLRHTDALPRVTTQSPEALFNPPQHLGTRDGICNACFLEGLFAEEFQVRLLHMLLPHHLLQACGVLVCHALPIVP